MEDKEMVEHPKHYNQGNIEVIDAIEDWELNFSIGNVLKYVGRAETKGDKIVNLEKALWYLKREIDKEEK